MNQLARDGYIVLEGFMSPALLAEARASVDRLYAEEGDAAGLEFKQEPGCRRLANLVNKGEIFRRLLAMPELLEHVTEVLGAEFKLSSFNARSANPMSYDAQPLHCDMGGLPDERGDWVCNSVWMLDDFTASNGPTRVVPGSHRWGKLPQQALVDPLSPHPDEVLLTGPAGSVVVYNAHLWHGGTANQTAKPRSALHIFFARRDKPQQQYQKELLDPDVQRSLSPGLRHLLALDDALNDQLAATSHVRSGFLK